MKNLNLKLTFNRMKLMEGITQEDLIFILIKKTPQIVFEHKT